jgi:DNA mismatch repair protein MutS
MNESGTPLLRQYHAVKAQHPRALLLFRLGDFYELFFDDALVASRVLQITLTSRNREKGQAVPMCGVPYHAAESYIAKLIQAGHRVAICEQMEEAGPGKKLVRREVVRVLTPGTATSGALLNAKENRFLAAVARAAREDVLGLAYVDLSTGEFRATEFRGEAAEARLADALNILRPKELLVARPSHLFGNLLGETKPSGREWDAPTAQLEDWVFHADYAARLLEEQLRVASLDGFGLDGHAQAVAAAGAIVHYLRETTALAGAGGASNGLSAVSAEAIGPAQSAFATMAAGIGSATGATFANGRGAVMEAVTSASSTKIQEPIAALAHIDSIQYYEQQDALLLDQVAVRNLELVEPLNPFDAAAGKATLIASLDETCTAMGGRLLRGWMARPEIEAVEIEARLDAVAALKLQPVERDQAREILKSLIDVARIAGRVALALVTPRELLALKKSFDQIPRIRELLGSGGLGKSARVAELAGQLDDLADLRKLIASAIADDPPPQANEPGTIRGGYNAELDELRTLSRGGKQAIAAIEERERKRTGIQSLKVRFNQIFGYYIEISKANLHLAPADYERKQTLVNAERFTAPELRELERKILEADSRILEIERRLYTEVREKIATQSARLRRTAAALAQIDVLMNFAELAASRNYTRPVFSEERPGEGGELLIAGGRHVVIEQLLAERGERFVPNDLYLDHGSQSLLLITGPNMGGKSTYLRQAALIVIMAQMGSFVPATQAQLPLTDRIFTRIGASDSLARGQSTFLVEMSEVASILNTATAASLVLLDEVGRGTATFDGLSIAWAVVEALEKGARPRTLFATHYHELTELEGLVAGVRNVHVSVRELGNQIIFLRRVEAGAADKSYGIEVARLAGLPSEVIARAREILARHETKERRLSEELTPGADSPKTSGQSAEAVPVLTVMDEKVLEALRGTNLDELKPIEALNLLARLKGQLE